MAFYYRVLAKKLFHEDGTEKGFTPDIPSGLTWVGQISNDGKWFIVKTDKEVPAGPDRKALVPIKDLEKECPILGIDPYDANDKWKVGGK